MGLRLNESYELHHDPDVVWQHLGDLQFVASCFPGATLDRYDPDGDCHGQIAMKLGPTKVTFSGSVRIELDQLNRTAVLQAKGGDEKRSKASAVATVRVEPAATATNLHVEADVDVIGPLSQFARSGGKEITRVLLADFVSAVDVRLDASAATGPGAPENSGHGEAVAISPGRMVLHAARATVRGWWARLAGLLRFSKRHDREEQG